MTNQHLTIRDVRERGQQHPHLAADPTYARAVVRRVSPFVTFGIVRFTAASADAVTATAIASGIVGGVLTAIPSLWTNVLAILLLQLAYLLDVADGEVARVRGTSGKRGTYLDLIGHFLQNRALYGGSTFALVVSTDYASWAIVVALLGVGFASAFGEQSRDQVLGRRDASSPHGARAADQVSGRGPYALYRRIAFLWNYPASMNLFCIALLADAARFAFEPGAEALVLPWFAGAFAVTLAVRQFVNAVRQLAPHIWQ